MNIGALRHWGREELLRSGVASAQLDADLLLADALGCSREHLMAHGEDEVPPAHDASYQAAIQRRVAQEPVAYILGKKEFFGIEFKVSPAVLIPRPETELLVEEALRIFLTLSKDEELLLLDIGTGSGAILLSVMHAAEELRKRSGKTLPQMYAYGSDISESALEVARTNAEALRLSDKVDFIQESLLNGFSQEVLHRGTYAIIIANLPYISSNEALPKEVVDFEPASALFGGEGGAEIVLDCINQVNRFRPCSRGCLLLEIGQGQREVLAEKLGNSPGIVFDFIPDLQGISRVAKINYRELCS